MWFCPPSTFKTFRRIASECFSSHGSVALQPPANLHGSLVIFAVPVPCFAKANLKWDSSIMEARLVWPRNGAAMKWARLVADDRNLLQQGRRSRRCATHGGTVPPKAVRIGPCALRPHPQVVCIQRHHCSSARAIAAMSFNNSPNKTCAVNSTRHTFLLTARWQTPICNKLTLEQLEKTQRKIKARNNRNAEAQHKMKATKKQTTRAKATTKAFS